MSELDLASKRVICRDGLFRRRRDDFLRAVTVVISKRGIGDRMNRAVGRWNRVRPATGPRRSVERDDCTVGCIRTTADGCIDHRSSLDATCCRRMVIAARITSRITHPAGRHLHIRLLTPGECSDSKPSGNKDDYTQHCQRPRAHLAEGVRLSTQKPQQVSWGFENWTTTADGHSMVIIPIRIRN